MVSLLVFCKLAPDLEAAAPLAAAACRVLRNQLIPDMPQVDLLQSLTCPVHNQLHLDYVPERKGRLVRSIRNIIIACGHGKTAVAMSSVAANFWLNLAYDL